LLIAADFPAYALAYCDARYCVHRAAPLVTNETLP
jgi:hypothetical protein